MRRSSSLVLAAAIGITGVAVGTQFASGAGESEESVFISITPCRLIDTRAGEENVGPVASPIAQNSTVQFNAHDGSDGDSSCEIPSSATAIATNTVAVNPTARSFLALFPGDADNPGTANLNFVAGQAPTPNAANIPLAGDGTFNVFNAFGTVDVIIDVNGFYQPSTAVGATGPQGPQGPQGEPGEEGAVGDVTLSHGFGPTIVNNACCESFTSIVFDSAYTRVGYDGGGAVVQRPLTGPVSFGASDQYRLASVEYCVDNFVGANTSIFEAAVRGGDGGELIDDTDRTAAGCYNVDLSAMSAQRGYVLEFFIAGSGANGSVHFTGLQSTWTTSPAAT